MNIPIAATNGVKIKYCCACGFWHQDPIPTQRAIDAYYANDEFYKSGKPDWFLKEEREYRAGLWDARYAWEMRQAKGLPCIDVGCGPGWAVHYWEQHGQRAVGIEPSKSARQVSPVGRALYPDYAQAMDALHKDKVTNAHVRMSLVLEHVVDPRAFINGYLDTLGDDGRLIVTVPNEFNPLQRRIGGDFFISPYHINYFTPAGLRWLLGSCGLEIIHESATFPMELFVLMGRDYRGNDELGRKCHNMRLRFEKMLGITAYRLYQLWYKRHGWGRELIFVGKKGGCRG